MNDDPFLAIARKLRAEDDARRAVNPDKQLTAAFDRAAIEQDEARNQAWSLGRPINVFRYFDDGAPA